MISLSKLFWGVCLLPLVATVPGCDKRHPVDDTTFPPPPESTCEVTRTVVESLSADTSVGMNAADVLAFASGSHTTAIRWETGREDVELVLDVPQPAAEITATIVYTGADIIDEESQLVVAEGGDGGDVMCVSSLRIPITLSIVTSDGALADSWDTELVQLEFDPLTLGAAVPYARASKPLTDLQGALEILGAIPDGWTVGEVTVVELQFPTPAPKGALSVAAEPPPGLADQSALQVGTW